MTLLRTHSWQARLSGRLRLHPRDLIDACESLRLDGCRTRLHAQYIRRFPRPRQSPVQALTNAAGLRWTTDKPVLSRGRKQKQMVYVDATMTC